MKKLIIMSIAEASAMTPARIGTAFYERSKIRTKAFIEQGKLTYALQQKTLRKGQSIQSILTEKGSPSGSVDNARKAAAIIEALVIPEHIFEDTFDKVVTFRIARFANKVLGLNKNSTAILTPESVAEIINEGKSSAEIANTLECWNEHKCSPSEHEDKLKAAAKAQKEADKEAAKRAAEIAADDAEYDANEEADETTVEPPAPTNQETEHKEDQPKDSPQAEETKDTPPAPPVVIPDPTPQGVTAENILERIMEVRLDATELSADDMAAVLNEINEFQQELIDSLNALKVAA